MMLDLDEDSDDDEWGAVNECAGCGCYLGECRCDDGSCSCSNCKASRANRNYLMGMISNVG